MQYPVVAVFLTILAAGILGGLGNAFLQDFWRHESDDNDQTVTVVDWLVLGKSTVLGVIAAAVVPLFLELVVGV